MLRTPHKRTNHLFRSNQLSIRLLWHGIHDQQIFLHNKSNTFELSTNRHRIEQRLLPINHTGNQRIVKRRLHIHLRRQLNALETTMPE